MIDRYQQRAAAHGAARDEAAIRSKWIARARLATVLPGIAALIWAMSRGGGMIPGIAAAVLLTAFAALVVWHARVEDRRMWFDALHTVNVTAVARIARAWDRLPPADLPADTGATRLDVHPYAIDLDLFGRASLMQWLGPPATAPGADVLQQWLLRPASPRDVELRQGAVVALATASDWREQFAAHGRLVANVRRRELERFLEWSSSAGPFTPAQVRALQLTTWALTAAIWLLIALQSAGATAAALWLIPVVLGMILSFVTAFRVHGEFDRAGAGEQAFRRYAHLFVLATLATRATRATRATETTHAAAAPMLDDLHARLAATGVTAPEGMRRFNRILGFASLRAGAGIMHFLVQALTLWDLHVFFALDRWRRTVGSHVRDWMHALGELDALAAFAQVNADNPTWCMPRIVDPARPEDRVLRGTQLGHPLIPDDRRVANDAEIGPPSTLLLITGSNMSGKSTFLRAVGLNTVLAQAGAPVCATAFSLPPVHLETCIRVQDSLEHGLSYFMAALARLKGVVDRSRAVEGGQTVLYLLDEILQGTNTVERALAVRGVARHLLATGAIGVMTTHDLGLAAEEPLNQVARLGHFTELVDERGGMTFDYRLRPGLATSRNALRLMHLIGIPFEDA